MTSPMTRDLAYSLLNIPAGTATLDEIRTQYKLSALKYHPDKNNAPDATEKFHQIREAYEYLMHRRYRWVGESDSESDDESDPLQSQEPKAYDSYKTMFGTFLTSVFFPSPTQEHDITVELCRLVVSKLVGLCETRAMEYIEKIDRTTLGKIYGILEKYRDVFHLSDTLMGRIVDILSKTTECILLNPSLDDLMEDNLYKITDNGRTFIVPLWHHELVYDNSGVDFVVRCCPVLPEHMEIDEDNNIYVYLDYRLSDLWGKETIAVPFGKTTLEFQTKHIYLTAQPQTIRLPNCGIARIHSTNMFDNSVRKDVVLVIQLL